VWIYKGDILPYKTQNADKIEREAAMAAGETSGQSKPRKVVSSSAAPRATDSDEVAEVTPLVKEADPEFERLLAEEERLEANTRESHETPNFRPGDGD
jgi:small subunit ribosomal protein S3